MTPRPVDLTSPWFFSDPSPNLERLRSEAPVTFHAPLDAWVLTRHADVAAILGDRRLEPCVPDGLAPFDAALREWLPFGARAPEGPLRARLDAGLTAARDLSARPLAEAIVMDLLAPFDQRDGSFDVKGELAQPLSARSIGAIVGIPDADLALLTCHSRDIARCLGAVTEVAVDARRAHAGLSVLARYFAELLDRKQGRPTSDLASSLADRAFCESAPRGETARALTVLVVGMLSITERLVGQTVLELLTHEGAFERVAREPRLTRNAVDETLRHNGPVLCVMRRAREDVAIDGRTVRSGERVGCMVHAANRDPAVYAAPEVFDLDRELLPHLGFASVCPTVGEELVRLIVEVAVGSLAARLPRLHLTGAAPRTGDLLLRNLARLPVRYRGGTTRRRGAPLRAAAPD